MTTTRLPYDRPATRAVVRLAAAASAGVAYFALVIAVLHVLRPDLSPVSQPTSQYAVGPYWWLMTSAFFSMSLASFALVAGLARGIADSGRSPLGLGLLCVWAVGVLIAMIFPLNPIGTPATLASTIHRATGPLTFLSLTLGVTLVSSRFRHDERWHAIRRTALILAVVMQVAFVLTFMSFATGSAMFGLAQRLALGPAVTWMLLIAAHLRVVALNRPGAIDESPSNRPRAAGESIRREVR